MTRAEWARRPGRESRFVSRAVRFAIYLRDGFRCRHCGKDLPISGKGASLDHVVPRKHGGSHAPENLITSCLRCNSRRQHRSPALPVVGRAINVELGAWLAGQHDHVGAS